MRRSFTDIHSRVGKELFHTSVGGLGSPDDGGENGVAASEGGAGILGGVGGGSSAPGMSHTTNCIVLTHASLALSPYHCCFDKLV